MERHIARIRCAERQPQHLTKESWEVLGTAPVLDSALSLHMSKWPQGPDILSRTTWPEIIMWGADQTINCFRLLRLGDYVGSAILARNQLERWTLNVAAHHKVSEQRNGESSADFLRRVWQVYPIRPDDIDPGDAWVKLSELIHGRLFGDLLYEYMWLTGSLDYIDQTQANPLAEVSTLISKTLSLGLSRGVM